MARSQRSSIVHVPESRDNSTSPRAPHSCPISQAIQKQTMREGDGLGLSVEPL